MCSILGVKDTPVPDKQDFLQCSGRNLGICRLEPVALAVQRDDKFVRPSHHTHCELPERASLVLLVHLWLPLEHPHLPPAGQHRRQVKFGQINKFSQNSHRKTNVYMSNTNTSQIEITSKKKTSLHLSNTSQKENQFSPVWSLSKVLSRLKPLEHPHLPPLVTIIDHDHNFLSFYLLFSYLFIFHLYHDN